MCLQYECELSLYMQTHLLWLCENVYMQEHSSYIETGLVFQKAENSHTKKDTLSTMVPESLQNWICTSKYTRTFKVLRL